MTITDYDKLQVSTKEIEADLLEADLITRDQLERIWLNCQYSPDTLKDYFEILFNKWLDNFDLETMTENIKAQKWVISYGVNNNENKFNTRSK